MAEHPVTRFRRLLRLLVARARRRPRLTVLSVLLVAIAVGAAGTLVALSHSPVVPAPIGPVAVYSATWTLTDLTRHADNGDVAAITVPRSAAGDPPAPAILVARNRDGALIRVDLTVDPGAAASALASLGHGDLLTADAWAVVRSPRADATANDPLRTILGWVIPLSLVALLILFVNRMARGGARGDGSGGVLTILPRRRPPPRPPPPRPPPPPPPPPALPPAVPRRGGANPARDRTNPVLPSPPPAPKECATRAAAPARGAPRPGRFGRKTPVGRPAVVGRGEILTFPSRGKPFAPAVALDVVARKPYGFSGAQRADLLNEAAILAARRKGDMV